MLKKLRNQSGIGKHTGQAQKLTEQEKETARQIIKQYETFYEKHGRENISLYGLLHPGYQSTFHTLPFFYHHAPLKMVAANQDAFGCSSALCLTCINGIGKYSNHHQRPIVVADPVGTYLFGSNPPEVDPLGWKEYDLGNGVSYFYREEARG